MMGSVKAGLAMALKFIAPTVCVIAAIASFFARSQREKLLAQGWRIADTSAASLAQRIRGDSRLYGDLIAKKHIRLE